MFDSFVDWIKNALGTEKGKSVFTLIAYFIIAGFAVFMASKSYNDYYSNKVTTNPLDNYASRTGYTASYTINGSDSYLYIDSSKPILKIADKSYYIEDNNLVSLVDGTSTYDNIDLRFWYLTPSVINKMINLGTKNYTKTYTNGTIEIDYILTLDKFATNFTGNTLSLEDTSFTNNKNVEITVLEKNSSVTTISINLTSYYDLLVGSNKDYLLKIDYE